MTHFYDNLKKGLTKDKALQQAKITYLKEKHNTFPCYWGQFVIMGNTAPLTKNVSNWWAWLLGIVLLLFLCFLIKAWTR